MALNAMQELTLAGNDAWLAGTIMPNHIHALFELTEKLPLHRVIAKLKGNITRRLRHAVQTPIWQENVFEHRIRPDEDAEVYAFYMYMNPYRAGIWPMEKSWPWWLCTAPCRFRFLDRCRENGSPQPEWLAAAEKVAGTIIHRA